MGPPARERSVIGGSAALIGSRYVQAAMGYVGGAIIARTLSPGDFGGYTLIFGVLGILGIVCDVNAGRKVVSEILDAGADAGDVIGSYMTLRFLIALVAYGAAIAFIAFGDYPQHVLAATVLGASVLVLAATWSALSLLFRARLWLHTLAIAAIVAQAVQLALTVLVASGDHPSLMRFMWPAVAFDIATFAVLVMVGRRHVRLRLRVQPRQWWTWTKEAVPINLGASLASVYFKIDTVMVSQLDTLRAVGLYGIGYKFSDLIGFLPSALLAPVFTLMVQAWPTAMDSFRRTYRGAFVIMVVSAVGLTAGFAAYAHPAITTLYGARFGSAAGAARLVVVGQALHFFTALCVTLLIATGRHRIYPFATLAGVAINVGLNLVLIPHYSIQGAGWATIVTEAIVLAILIGAVRRVPGLGPAPWAVIVRALGAAAALGAVAWALHGLVPWPVGAAAAGAAFLAVLHVVGIDGPGGLRSVRHLLRPIDAPATETLPEHL